MLIWRKDVVYVVTSGYVKKQQNTDKQELERALRKMNEFIRGEERK